MNKDYTASENRTIALLVVGLSSFLTPYIFSAVNIALPTIGKEFTMDAVVLGWVQTSYLLAAAMSLLPSGRIADISGRKKIFTLGMCIFTVSSLLSALSRSATFLIFCRALQGIGGAMVYGTGIAILSSVFTPQQRGKVIGIVIGATYFGLSLGPFLGGLLTEHFGWPSIFYITIPMGLIIIVLTLGKLKGEWAEAEEESFDFKGTIVYCLTLFSLIYGFTILPRKTGFGLIIAGIIGLVLFIMLELHTDHPLLKINLFKDNRLFAFSNLAALVIYSSTFATSFLLSLYLQYIKGFGPQAAGLILVSRRVMQAIFSPSAGRISDRFEPWIIASLGLFFTIIGLILLTTLDSGTSTLFIIITLAALGLGFALFSSPNINAIMGSVTKQFYGVASAMTGTMRVIGQTLSMGITMIVIAMILGRVQITPANYPSFLKSMKSILTIFVILCCIGLLISLTRGKLRR